MSPCCRLVLLVACALIALPCVADSFQPIREMEVQGQRIIIDNTNTQLSIEVQTEFVDAPKEADLARGLFRSYKEAAAAAETANARVLPSVALVYAKGKKFDDGTYAAVELALENPFGKLELGKRKFLADILRALEQRHATYQGFAREACEQAMGCLVSALVVGGQIQDYSFPAQIIINENVGRKPIGFYTWSPELAGIFRRDTALQERYEPPIPQRVGGAAIVADIITSDPELLATYDRLRDIYWHLTNRMTGLTAQDVMAEVKDVGGMEAVLGSENGALKLGERVILTRKPGFALLEESDSKERGLLWLAASMGLSSMDELIEAIRSGRIDLKPNDTSGWYEYQQYALEPLLMPDRMPEGKKLELGPEYRKLLEEHFKSMIADIRETHVKQLELVEGVAPPPPSTAVTVEPYLAVEPIATTYARFAKAYDFLGNTLATQIGEQALTELHVLDEGARPGPETVGEGLAKVRGLMSGAHLLTCRDIGIQPELKGDDLTATMGEAEQWLETWTGDPDMARDVRQMIVVSRTPDVYWAVIGVKLAKLNVRFTREPKVSAADPGVQVNADFVEASYWVPYERFIEVTAEGEPLNREEFRALCDRYKTEERIQKALPKAILRASITPPEPLDIRTGPTTAVNPPWYIARPWMIWAGVGGLIGAILIIAVIARIVGGAAGTR